MKQLFKYFKPYIWQFCVLLVMVYLMVMATLALPDYMAIIINKGIILSDMSVVWHNGWIMLFYALGAAAASIVVGWFASRIAAGFSRDIRAATFAKVESFSLHEFNTFSTASLITRSTNDVQQIQMVLTMLLRMALMAPIMGVWAIIRAYQNAPSMTWLMALAVGVLIAIVVTLFTIAIPRFKKLQKLVDRLNLVSREILTGLRVIRAFNREKIEEKKFDIANVELTKANLFVNRLLVIMQPVMILIMNLTTVAVIWYGAHLVDLGNLQIGQMLAFMQYAVQAIFAFLLITIVFIMVPRAAVSVERIAKVLATEATITDPKNPIDVSRLHGGKIEFNHVTFSYAGADEPIVRDVSFTAVPGQTTAIIGSTGSGKSTLINLIPRFYDVTDGSVKIDGVDVRHMRMEDVYSKIGYIPQKGVLFSGTVASNIKYGAPNATTEEVATSIEISQAKEFIDQLDGGHEAEISQGGVNVSGGQKQRLSIARAIIRKPEIFIFDDSFSALDFTTDAKLRDALTVATQQKTVLIVAQRISTIMNAEKIIVLDEGRVVGEGTHQDLLATCSVYKEIASSQLSEEELRGNKSSTITPVAAQESV
ncbi:MAG: multidrug ABC transporter ATP-binding protein [Candidatus Kerfeldbacteria bacterium CG08_land_8_20_14_0_20_42_7]|uniref:Multidrug ABC transporter ATP-binding protein n=1 Tax=Candidatus Kerfeldbacteria bacterium CG08_land_8_20_14_0_20_42_7 TaxID=2014245 RepID=A0A2H0YUH0_9BACT|nr:MAG: multidrug ABC transporter ATP-binding protein [Candidatus Kerfeldbacteria bacterium CG08_land_8_20_14_0_20_42_7]